MFLLRCLYLLLGLFRVSLACLLPFLRTMAILPHSPFPHHCLVVAALCALFCLICVCFALVVIVFFFFLCVRSFSPRFSNLLICELLCSHYNSFCSVPLFCLLSSVFFNSVHFCFCFCFCFCSAFVGILIFGIGNSSGRGAFCVGRRLPEILAGLALLFLHPVNGLRGVFSTTTLFR